jgi:clan AA aspartic protease (TIGR02281 family)
MRIRAAVVLVVALVTGWGLGWYMRDRGASERPLPGRSVDLGPPLAAGLQPSTESFTVARSQDNGGLQQLLERKAFGRAVDWYEALQKQADETATQRARVQLLAHAHRLNMQSDYASAIRLLQLYLEVAYRDVEARTLLAESYRADRDFRLAIEQLYVARGEAYRVETLDQLTVRIRALVAEYTGELKRQNDHTGLLDLYQQLTQFEPSHAPYFLQLASAQLALGDNYAARQSLLLVAQDAEVGAQAQELLERIHVDRSQAQQPGISTAATDVSGVPLLRSGNHFLVDARLGRSQPARLLIDTGASLTILTPDMLKSSGADAHATGRTGAFTTANGRIMAPIYRLNTLSVGDWQVSNLEVGVLELGNASIDGLLGMNFLRHFQFFIDQNEALLHLSITGATQ